MKRMNFYSVRLVKEKAQNYDVDSFICRSPEDAYKLADKLISFEELTKEHFCIATLNTKNKIVGFHVVHVGSLNASVVHPRESFQLAILNNAASIILYHNHPSGDPTPSREDIEVTKRMVECGKILGIDVLDHVIAGTTGRYVSLKERGDL